MSLFKSVLLLFLLLTGIYLFAEENSKFIVVSIYAKKDLSEITMEVKKSDSSAEEKYLKNAAYTLKLLNKKSQVVISKKLDFIEQGDIIHCPETITSAKCEQPEKFKRILIKFRNIPGIEAAQLHKGKQVLAEAKITK